jgi:transposase-like protein
VFEHREQYGSQWEAIRSIAEKIGCSAEALRKWVRRAEIDAGRGGARPPTEVMVAFIDEYRGSYGVEPICRVLPIAPSTYYEQKAREGDASRLPPRLVRDASCAKRSSGSGRRTGPPTGPARSGCS